MISSLFASSSIAQVQWGHICNKVCTNNTPGQMHVGKEYLLAIVIFDNSTSVEIWRSIHHTYKYARTTRMIHFLRCCFSPYQLVLREAEWEYFMTLKLLYRPAVFYTSLHNITDKQLSMECSIQDSKPPLWRCLVKNSMAVHSCK